MLEVVFRPNHLPSTRLRYFVAIRRDLLAGSAVVPFRRQATGSTTFLPFRSDHIYVVDITNDSTHIALWKWRGCSWGEPTECTGDCTAQIADEGLQVLVPIAGTAQNTIIPFAAYAKAMDENDGWGRMVENAEFEAPHAYGDAYIGRFQEIDLANGKILSRRRQGEIRPRVYQLLLRLFGNTNETRKHNGTIAENGCGKFSDLNGSALASLKALGATHLWLTGVLQQATATAYPEVGEPADDADLLKGLAGSPYAIKDYFDLCLDYAEEPARRLEEFRYLLGRIRSQGLKAIIDFVPNHVARSYRSDIMPELSFGARDDRRQFFAPNNNFFYLHPEDHGHGPPLSLPTMEGGRAVSPTCQVLGTCDGRYDGELAFGRVTGNNVVSWNPTLNDWYETVKLNYGFDFTTGARAFPRADAPDCPVPDTWLKMDLVIAYWQQQGVDGFRCDMAHMVPPEFWAWLLSRARARQPGVFFVAEAYDNDPSRVRSADPLLQALEGGRGHVLYDLLNAGFDAVYDDPSYKALKSIYDGGGWANDLDRARPHDFIFQNSLRYAENHDEVRLASKGNWGGLGAKAGLAVSAVLFGLSRGPLLLYSGQEVGEPAEGAAGFGGDNGRTTIFDYWSMPELVKWVNDGRFDGARLSPEQAALRTSYGRLWRLAGEPAFERGVFYGLNPANLWNDQYGRLPGEDASGHWLYCFLRCDPESGQRFLVAANLHPDRALENVLIHLPGEALNLLSLGGSMTLIEERLAAESARWEIPTSVLADGLRLAALPPLSVGYFQLSSNAGK